MDTRKLITVLFFLLFTAPLFAQENNTPAVVISKNDVTLFKNSKGHTVIQWKNSIQPALEFLVQASIDGGSFRAVKRIVAAPSNNNNRYQTTDESGKNYKYYRILCIDVTGNYSYSKAVPVK